jgi:hypothetical protein
LLPKAFQRLQTTMNLSLDRSAHHACTRGLDTRPDARPPHEQQIVLVNADEVRAMAPRLWET